MMSRYDDILAALEARLAGIRQAAGFRTDGGLRVWKNLEYQTAPPETPCLIYYPGTVSDSLGGETPPSQGEENHFLPIKIDGLIADTERGDAAEALRQDVLQALKSAPYFGGLTEGFEGALTSSSKTVAAAESEGLADGGFLGFVEVEAIIFYVTEYGVQ